MEENRGMDILRDRTDKKMYLTWTYGFLYMNYFHEKEKSMITWEWTGSEAVRLHEMIQIFLKSRWT